MFLRLRGWLYWRRLDRQIRKFGWTGIHLAGDHRDPGWSYTVGLARHGWPEVVISGTPSETANAIFHEIYRQLGSGQLAIREDASWSLPDWVTCAWRRVHPERIDFGLTHFATMDRWKLTGDPHVEVFQLVFPDEQLGRLPWEAGFDESFRRLQTELWRPLSPAELTLRSG